MIGRSALIIVLAAAWLGGCSSSSSSADGGQTVQAACGYSDFSATVRTGPSAGTEFKGLLSLAQTDATTLRGSLVTTAGDGGSEMRIPVTGQLAGRNVTLTF